MATVIPVHDDDAPPDVCAIFQEIRSTLGRGSVPPLWRALANDPPSLRRAWAHFNEAMAPGALDALVKEMIYLAVSVTSRCDYCIQAHTRIAKQLGMTDQMLAELMQVVSTAAMFNQLVVGYQLQPTDADQGKQKARRKQPKP